MNNKYPNLGEKLKHFRKRAGLSQLDLETETKASAGTISRIENGTINPTKETILKIAEQLELNDLEISYLIGRLARPASDVEISKALEEIKSHFNRKHILSYLLDDRSRMLALSEGFKKLLGLDEKDTVAFLGKTMPQIILNHELGLRQYIETDNFQESLYFAFKRTWDEMNFMLGDPYYKEIMTWINKEPFLKKKWEEFYIGETPKIRTDESRTVYFSYKGRIIKMLYTNEILPKFPRFRVVDYTPTNFVVKLLQKLT